MEPDLLARLELHRTVGIEELDDLRLRGRGEREVEDEDDGAERVAVDVGPPVFHDLARHDDEGLGRDDDLTVPPGGRVVAHLVVEGEAHLRRLGRESFVVGDLVHELVTGERAVERRALQRHVGVHGVGRLAVGRGLAGSQQQAQGENLHGFLGVVGIVLTLLAARVFIITARGEKSTSLE